MLESIIGSAMSWKMAEKQMRFQERMASTQYQRAVKDLVAAGLNPMLAAKFGGAAAPPGAMGRITPGDTVGSALSAKERLENIKNIKKQRSVMDSQMSLMQAQASAAGAQAAKTAAEAKIQTTRIPAAEALKDLYESQPGYWIRILREVFGTTVTK